MDFMFEDWMRKVAASGSLMLIQSFDFILVKWTIADLSQQY